MRLKGYSLRFKVANLGKTKCDTCILSRCCCKGYRKAQTKGFMFAYTKVCDGTDGWMDRLTDEWMERWTDGWISDGIHPSLCKVKQFWLFYRKIITIFIIILHLNNIFHSNIYFFCICTTLFSENISF